jgi:hypothetical protein
MIYKIIDSMLKDLGLKTKGDGRGPHTFRHYAQFRIMRSSQT